MSDASIIERLPILILSPHNRCNCRCVMCDIWKLDTVQEIGLSDLEGHLREIVALGVQWVVFSGGEPLMHSDLFRLSRSLRGHGIRTTILSSGLLLAKNASRLVSEIDDVIVSLDGPPRVHDHVRGIRGAFDLLAMGVREMHSIRPDFPVAARTTVQRSNFAFLRETVRTARGLDLQSISFLAADTTSTAFNRREPWPDERRAQVALTADEADGLEVEMERLIGDMDEHPGFILETPEKLRRIVRHFRVGLGLLEPEAPRCNAPWVSAVVESDGTVRPCFFHEPIGNVTKQTLPEVLNGPGAVLFRQTLDISRDTVCQRCVCSLFLGPETATARTGRGTLSERPVVIGRP
ncbi:MAG TPA: radical SAM protein [Acidobacteriota bacterium]|nr:radical SAM protein [Acidobacteriota bacterium]